jgi:hypothetical protein
MIMALSRDQILEAADLTTQVVAVPEWGGDVIVSGMTGEMRDAWEQSLVIADGGKARTNMENIRARLVAATVVDAQGNRLFTDKDVAMLGRKSSAALERVCKVAQRLNGLTNEDVEQLKGN